MIRQRTQSQLTIREKAKMKNYMKFCELIAVEVLKKKEEESGPLALPIGTVTMAVAIVIPFLFALDTLPVVCAFFLLYGFGTNFYTGQITIGLVLVSMFLVSSTIGGIKKYAYPKN